MHTDRYSRMVAWLKVSLPLLALAILSTLFLISRAVDPPARIPFADSEVQKRLSNQQVTGPYFSGTSAKGDQISIIADTVTASGGAIGSNVAQNVSVQIDFASGLRADVVAQEALIDIAADQSRLTGEVKIVTSQGYTLESEQLLIQMSSPAITSPDAVFATTPLGTIEAGAMQFVDPEGNKDSQLVFTNGVKLIYGPQK